MLSGKQVFVLILASILIILAGCEDSQLNQKQKPSETVQPQNAAKITLPPPKPEKPKIIQKPSFNSKFDKIFKNYVDENGLVDYAKLNRTRPMWKPTLIDIAGLDKKDYDSWQREEKIAFWINSYNLFTIKLIVDNYPIKPLWYRSILYPPNSIMHITDAWDKNYFTVMGIEYTLREIEHEMLLKQFGDPKVCFAISYASLGSPKLRNEPFYGKNLDAQLANQIKKYLSTPLGLEINRVEQSIYLSVIFTWYKDAFTNKYGTNQKYRARTPDVRAFLNFISEYAPEDQQRFLSDINFTIKYRRYDWTLNQQ